MNTYIINVASVIICTLRTFLVIIMLSLAFPECVPKIIHDSAGNVKKEIIYNSLLYVFVAFIISLIAYLGAALV
jgi:hypothetical protein